jgi:hypothetical protein
LEEGDNHSADESSDNIKVHLCVFAYALLLLGHQQRAGGDKAAALERARERAEV